MSEHNTHSGGCCSLKYVIYLDFMNKKYVNFCEKRLKITFSSSCNAVNEEEVNCPSRNTGLVSCFFKLVRWRNFSWRTLRKFPSSHHHTHLSRSQQSKNPLQSHIQTEPAVRKAKWATWFDYVVTPRAEFFCFHLLSTNKSLHHRVVRR